MSGKVEVMLLCLNADDAKTWTALVHPGRKMRTGERIQFDGDLEATILARGEYGERTLRFSCEGDLYTALEHVGHVPFPPYIKRVDTALDPQRYQTAVAPERVA